VECCRCNRRLTTGGVIVAYLAASGGMGQKKTEQKRERSGKMLFMEGGFRLVSIWGGRR